MERNEYGDLIARWKVDLIGARARRLCFQPDEIDDLEQIIVQQLLQTDFDPEAPGGASERTFVITVIDRQLMKVKRDRRRDRRRVNYESLPLDEDGLVTGKPFFRSRRPGQRDLRLDVKQALIRLTPAERIICEALKEGHSQAEIARRSARSKAAISNAIKRLRGKFGKWGLGGYMGQDESESTA